ncbi:MAG: hypothetical protein HFI38_00080 [Lachnospiraceae bacterium]|nr:hypothetical protein [Lachnospiraceae bacterium]
MNGKRVKPHVQPVRPDSVVKKEIGEILKKREQNPADQPSEVKQTDENKRE